MTPIPGEDPAAGRAAGAARPMGPIAAIIPSLATGGAEVQLVDQLNALQARGLAVRLVVLSRRVEPDIRAALRLAPEHVKVIGLGSDVIGPEFLRALPGALPPGFGFLRRAGAAKILCHLPPAHLYGRLLKLGLAATGRRADLYIWHHNPEWIAGRTDTWGKRALHVVNQGLARIADRAHWHISEAVMADNARHYFTRRNRVIHNAIDPDPPVDRGAAARILARHGQAATRYRVLLPGRLHRQKGHAKFIDALATVIRRDRLAPGDLGVLFVGEGPERAAIEARIARAGLGQYVQLAGRQPHAVLLGLMERADLVCVPSEWEGFGIVAIEALLMRTPVLVAGVDGLAEIVTDGRNGFVCPSSNPDALADRLSGVIAAGGAHGLDLEAARADCIARFSIERQTDRVLALLRE